MSLVCKLRSVALLRRVQCLTSTASRHYAEDSHSSTYADINETIYAGIVVKKMNYTGITAVIQSHAGLKIPVKSHDKTMKNKLQDLEVGMNVLVKGSLDQENVVRQVGDNFRRVGHNFINAEQIEIILPEEIETRKEERNDRIYRNA